MFMIKEDTLRFLKRNGNTDSVKNIIVFGGGRGQPQENEELNELCQDVINVAKRYDAKFIYTVGGYHTSRSFGKSPTTYVTTTSQDILKLVKKLGIEITPTESVITGFNGLILGYAKLNGINGIGLYGELLEPRIPQYRAARTIIETLEKINISETWGYEGIIHKSRSS